MKRPPPPYIKGGGRGRSEALLDRAFWLKPGVDSWVAAIEVLDTKDDKKPLLNLLRSKAPLSDDVRWFIADLLERYDLNRNKRGRPRTPAYDRTESDAMMELGIERVGRYMEYGRLKTDPGLSAQDAIAKAAKELMLGEDELANAFNGKRGSLRRFKERNRPEERKKRRGSAD